MCSLCKYLLTIFSCRTSAWKLWREMQLTKLFDKQNVRHLGKAKMKTQQIKYYWGWCQPHKNAWKLGMHVSSTRTFSLSSSPVPIEKCSTISSLKIDFQMVFHSFFQSLFGVFHKTSRKANFSSRRMLRENLLFVVFHISITAILKPFGHSWCWD